MRYKCASGRVDNFVYTTGRVGSGPEKSDPWSTLMLIPASVISHVVFSECFGYNQCADRFTLANAVINMAMRGAGDDFITVSATSGGRTATLTTGFDFQHGVSYSCLMPTLLL